MAYHHEMLWREIEEKGSKGRKRGMMRKRRLRMIKTMMKTMMVRGDDWEAVDEHEVEKGREDEEDAEGEEDAYEDAYDDDHEEEEDE